MCRNRIRNTQFLQLFHKTEVLLEVKNTRLVIKENNRVNLSIFLINNNLISPSLSKECP